MTKLKGSERQSQTVCYFPFIYWHDFSGDKSPVNKFVRYNRIQKNLKKICPLILTTNIFFILFRRMTFHVLREREREESLWKNFYHYS